MKNRMISALPLPGRLVGVALIAMICVGAFLITPQSAYGQSRYTIKLANSSRFEIYGLFMSSAEKKNWGKDYLNGVILAPGDKVTIIRIVPGEWDIKFVDEDGDECVLNDVKIFENYNWNITTDWLLNCEGFKRHETPKPAVAWVEPKGVFPSNAIKGGNEENGNPLYVCRAAYNGGIHPGKVVGLNCNIGYAGKEIHLSEYQLLVGNGSWGPAREGYTGAFVAGTENGRPLYLCRGVFSGGVHPGKIVGDKCNIGFGGVERTLPNFEVFYPR